MILFIKKFLKERAWEYSNSAAHIRNLTYHFNYAKQPTQKVPVYQFNWLQARHEKFSILSRGSSLTLHKSKPPTSDKFLALWFFSYSQFLGGVFGVAASSGLCGRRRNPFWERHRISIVHQRLQISPTQGAKTITSVYGLLYISDHSSSSSLSALKGHPLFRRFGLALAGWRTNLIYSQKIARSWYIWLPNIILPPPKHNGVVVKIIARKIYHNIILSILRNRMEILMSRAKFVFHISSAMFWMKSSLLCFSRKQSFTLWIFFLLQ